MKKSYSEEVLKKFLEKEPPHLALIRSIEATIYEDYLPLRGKILDVGCGDGFFAEAVFNKQPIDLGIDIEGSLWREAKNRGNYKKVCPYDGKKIPAADNTFDTVVCNCVLEHVPEAGQLIKEMARVLKPGGKLLATVVTDSFGDELWGTKVWGKRYKHWFNRKSVHVANVSPKMWRERYEEAGLKVTGVNGYMQETHMITWFDWSHYWGLINLLTRKITGKWVAGPSRWSNQLWKAWTQKKFNQKSVSTPTPYLFLVAEKIKTLG